MSSPLFLTLDQIILFHRKGLDLFGGTDGIRDEGALQSAVAQSLQVYFYENGDLFDIASSYCFHIAQAQAFLDENKRTAVAAGLTFLKLNGIDTSVDITLQFHEAMIQIANQQINRKELAHLLRKWLS